MHEWTRREVIVGLVEAKGAGRGSAEGWQDTSAQAMSYIASLRESSCVEMQRAALPRHAASGPGNGRGHGHGWQCLTRRRQRMASGVSHGRRRHIAVEPWSRQRAGGQRLRTEQGNKVLPLVRTAFQNSRWR